ncbi:MAG: 30S ribosomal protein S17 [Candidatus Eremiobacteraeota bacterium]|nr:30S ribosomal protein S17 [Candidatus Eremiobacteraeota bacterium]MBV8222881.1 30S ribosomal protein S17 [Candidatus Eremiobacteraeota bacterium]
MMEETKTEKYSERGFRKTRVGRVVSDKMQKSIVVKTETNKAHAYYGKITLRSTRYMAHDEKNDAKVGDLVRIAETRPLSARKRWRLVEIIERAK